MVEYQYGVDANDVDFGYAEKTGGEKEHKLTEEELPKIRPRALMDNEAGGYDYGIAAASNDKVDWSSDRPFFEFGGDQPHNNLQPYITCYMWKRVA